MFRWITKSRLRASIAVLLFALLFFIGLGITALRNPWHPSEVYTGLITALVSVIGTASTVFFAWRTDRRSAKESELKIDPDETTDYLTAIKAQRICGL
jgi:protein-S-isoprenylcysteine O-methyltransferase Ste14